MISKTHRPLKYSLALGALLMGVGAHANDSDLTRTITKVTLQEPKCDPQTAEDGCTKIEFKLAYPQDKMLEGAINLMAIEAVQNVIGVFAPDQTAELLKSQDLNDLAKRTSEIFDALYAKKEIMRKATLTIEGKLSEVKGKYLNVILETYWDVGGAHPAHETRIGIFDLKNANKPITIADLLSSEDLKAFTALVEAKLQKKLKDSYLKPEGDQLLTLLKKQVEVRQDNYRILFNASDVAAYALGDIEIIVKNAEMHKTETLKK